MTKTFCDICGKQILPGDVFKVDMDFSEPVPGDRRGSKLHSRAHLDLCHSCFVEVNEEYVKN